MKEGTVIKQITKLQRDYGVKHKIIRRKTHITTHKKIYVDDYIAMKIWQSIGINQDKVEKIKQDLVERERMSKESGW
jgi:hypothetical protein